MTHGPSNFNYDQIDDGRGVIFWLLIALSVASFIIMLCLLHAVLKAEPSAAIGREIRSIPCREGYAEHPDGSCWRLAGDVEVVGE